MHDADDEDKEIIARVLAGETGEFARLVDKYGGMIHGQMRNFSRDPGVSEDLAHEVFVEAYLGLSGYRGDAPFRHWLARIATFTGYRHWKTRRRQGREVPFQDGWDRAAPEEGDGEPRDPEAARRLLLELLADLPERDRVVLTLAYLEDCTTAEIADRLGWSRSIVPMRVFKAKMKLKRLARKEPWKGRLSWIRF